MTLELGGNAGVILHEDADIDYALGRIVAGGFGYSGQSCISVQRLYIHRPIFEQVRRRPRRAGLAAGQRRSFQRDDGRRTDDQRERCRTRRELDRRGGRGRSQGARRRQAEGRLRRTDDRGRREAGHEDLRAGSLRAADRPLSATTTSARRSRRSTTRSSGSRQASSRATSTASGRPIAASRWGA